MPANAPRANAKQQQFVAYIVLAGALIGGLVCGYYATLYLRSYVRMGDAPEQLTAAEALATPLNAGMHWVRLKGNLKLDCQNALQQLSNGSVEFTEYTGHDQTGRTFFLQYKGDTDCQTAASRPLEGLLTDPPIYWWTKNSMPAPNGPSAEIRIGYMPREELWEGLAAAALAIFLLGLFGYLAIKLPKPTAARPAMIGGAAVPKGL